MGLRGTPEARLRRDRRPGTAAGAPLPPARAARARLMTRSEATCPNCGARVEFRWSSAVQTVCPFCRSILVRQDVDLKKVGTVADLPPSSSPIQLGTAGRYRQKGFEVVGRIVYEWDQGGWNEWHVVFKPSRSWSLSRAPGSHTLAGAASKPFLLCSGNCSEGTPAPKAAATGMGEM